MILEELSADAPFPLGLVLDRRLTVVVGLGPERRAWLAAAVADALAGRRTPLWGVAQIVGMRVDLGDPLVVRGTAGVHPVIGPDLWRPDQRRGRRKGDNLWPSSSLPERSDAGGRPAASAAPVPRAAAAPTLPDGTGDAGVRAPRRRWRRSTPAAGEGRPGAGAAGPAPPPPVAAVVEVPPEVPPPVEVAEPPRPALLDDAGPPPPEPLVLPRRPVVAPPGGPADPPPPPPPALEGPAPAQPGPRPGPAMAPPAPEAPPDPPLDPRFEQEVAQRAADLAARRQELASARASASDAGAPTEPDPAPVLAALAEVERCRPAEEAAAGEARRLAARWAEAEEATKRARVSIVPPWLLDSARTDLEEARRQLAEAEAEAATDAEEPLDLALVDRLEAARARVVELETSRSRLLPARRQLQAARDEEAALLRRLGLPTYSSLALRLTLSRARAGSAARLERAITAVAEAEAILAELEAPRHDALAAAAAGHLAAVRDEVTAFFGHVPSDVDGALAGPRAPGPRFAAARTALAAALKAVGAEVPDDPDEVVAAAGTWLEGAADRAALVAGATAAARGRHEAARRAEEAVAAARERHDQAVAALVAAEAAAAARRALAQGAHRQVLARWRQEVEAAEAAQQAASARWTEASAEHERWATARQESATAHAQAQAEHRQAVADAERERAALLDAAQRQAVATWEEAVAVRRAEHDRRRGARAAWERQRAEVEAEWQRQVAAAAAERRRLEERRAEALAELAAWAERHAPAPSGPELEELLLQRVEANNAEGPAGAVPVVVDDALSSLPLAVAAELFTVLVRISADVQVVYLTDDPTIVSLARAVDAVIVEVAPG